MVIGKARFPLVLKHALDKATPASISDAFAVTGICPFNPDAVDKSQLVAASFEKYKQRSTDSDKDVVTTCTTCGSYARNPLVVHGLIPQELSDILMPPPVKPQPQKKSRRLVTEARLISGADMLQQLKEKEEEEIKKREGIERRKIELKEKRELKTKMEQEKKAKREQEKEERVKRREQQEEEKRQRKITREEQKQKRNKEREEKRKQKQKSTVHVAEHLAASFYACDVCGISGEADDEERGIAWYGCDKDCCQRWYHDD
ncbi:ensconsin-like [Ruditapes philippinarum]|uniref:ensconsin-like n=1 Tax=Ruditapes philippinarum TaxID=129788 RepID=UPI00295AB5BB|nr:ensconsin-like [Ruditapes philippinarum]